MSAVITTQDSHQVVYIHGHRMYQGVLRQKGRVVVNVGTPVHNPSTARATARRYLHEHGEPTLGGWVFKVMDPEAEPGHTWHGNCPADAACRTAL